MVNFIMSIKYELHSETKLNSGMKAIPINKKLLRLRPKDKRAAILDKKCYEFYTLLYTGDTPSEFSIMVAPPPTPP